MTTISCLVSSVLPMLPFNRSPQQPECPYRNTRQVTRQVMSLSSGHSFSHVTVKLKSWQWTWVCGLPVKFLTSCSEYTLPCSRESIQLRLLLCPRLRIFAFAAPSAEADSPRHPRGLLLCPSHLYPNATLSALQHHHHFPPSLPFSL